MIITLNSPIVNKKLTVRFFKLESLNIPHNITLSPSLWKFVLTPDSMDKGQMKAAEAGGRIIRMLA